MNSDADAGLSVRQTGTAVLPTNVSVDMVQGEVESQGEDGTVISDFYYNGVYVGNSVMRVQAADSASDTALLFGGTRDEQDITYDIFNPDSGYTLFINWRYILLAVLLLAVAAGILFLVHHSGNRKRRRTRNHLIIRK